MTEKTATATRIESDNDLHAAMRFADVMVNLLRDFIPHHCLRDARKMLIDTALDQGFELTTIQMRKQYEAWQSTQLAGLGSYPLGQG